MFHLSELEIAIQPISADGNGEWMVTGLSVYVRERVKINKVEKTEESKKVSYRLMSPV